MQGGDLRAPSRRRIVFRRKEDDVGEAGAGARAREFRQRTKRDSGLIEAFTQDEFSRTMNGQPKNEAVAGPGFAVGETSGAFDGRSFSAKKRNAVSNVRSPSATLPCVHPGIST
jgi:hypothetical protein